MAERQVTVERSHEGGILQTGGFGTVNVYTDGEERTLILTDSMRNLRAT